MGGCIDIEKSLGVGFLSVVYVTHVSLGKGAKERTDSDVLFGDDSSSFERNCGKKWPDELQKV